MEAVVGEASAHAFQGAVIGELDLHLARAYERGKGVDNNLFLGLIAQPRPATFRGGNHDQHFERLGQDGIEFGQAATIWQAFGYEQVGASLGDQLPGQVEQVAPVLSDGEVQQVLYGTLVVQPLESTAAEGRLGFKGSHEGRPKLSNVEWAAGFEGLRQSGICLTQLRRLFGLEVEGNVQGIHWTALVYWLMSGVRRTADGIER